jgi:ABC-type branched-subunit amino acid transport system ATPase component
VRLFHYVEIENFKLFGDKQRIELDHPAVIIGPNNCGKTSAIQALALWSQAVRTWYGIRGESKAKERPGVQLNRLEIVSVPVQKTRYFWSNVKVRSATENIYLIITVGVEFQGRIIPLAMRFHNDGDDLVYCRVKDESSYGPLDDEKARKEFLEYVIGIKVELLYPMSGLSTLEPVYQDRFIGTLMGQGRTAEVLRNLCFKVGNGEWSRIQGLMRRLFQVELKSPSENAQGGIELYYSPAGLPKESLELATSGRGFQQMLLIFAYLYGHKNSVLLIDEPDAHLEILRQRQIYVLLRDIATENQSQIVMVTHSEVILDEAVENNLTLILDGKAQDISSKAKAQHSLKIFGTENYVKAVDKGYVLYVEGSTDVDMLRALATRIQHPVAEEFDDRLNSYYIQNIYPEISMESELDRVEMGNETKPGRHFGHLRSLLPNLRGLAILDNDGRGRNNVIDQGLPMLYWSRYEAENYFITPDLLLTYTLSQYQTGDLFDYVNPDEARGVLDSLVLEVVFGGEEADFRTWKSAQPDQARLIWETSTRLTKLSAFAEEYFRRLSEKLGRPMLLRKGQLHRLVEFADAKNISNEVVQKLDALKTLLQGP